MGAGASAKASEAVAGTSAEDIQAVFGQLSPEQKAKLQDALAATEAAESAPPAVPEAAEAEAETEQKAAAPSEAAKPEGESASVAPFLAEYFAKAQARTADLIANQEHLLAIAMDPEAQGKLKEEAKQWYEAEAKPLLLKSFKHHDTRTDDVLDPVEAALFFGHLVKEETQLAKAMSALSIEAAIGISMARLESMLSPEQREEVKPQIEEQIKKAIEVAQAEVQKKEETYLADKEAHDAAAFKVLDTNNDGTLQLTEFIAAFEPDSEKNTELHLALGYLTKEEVEEQKRMQELAKAEAKNAAECNQQ